MDTLGESEPSLILYTGRQGEWEGELGEIAPLLNTSLQGDDYLAAFDANVRELASRLAVERKAEEALGTLHAEIETQSVKQRPPHAGSNPQRRQSDAESTPGRSRRTGHCSIRDARKCHF